MIKHPALTEVSQNRSFGGVQYVFDHASSSTKTTMRFSVYLPDSALEGRKPAPVLWYLSGLTCTHENATTKAGFQKMASAYEMAIICPDTSPRGDSVPDKDTYSLGQGAGFYVNATEALWADNYQMEDYITRELPALVADALPVDASRQSITGHSMGGHGALTLALKNPEHYKSVSAFSPITAPMSVPWGQEALSLYLGEDTALWQAYDTTKLLASGKTHPDEMLVDFGQADPFLSEQLTPSALENAASAAGQRLRLRLHPGFDHSYYFIASFMDDHLAHHARALGLA